MNDISIFARSVLDAAGTSPVCVPFLGEDSEAFKELAEVFSDAGFEVIDSESLRAEKESASLFEIEFECMRRITGSLESGRSVLVRRGPSVPPEYRHENRAALIRLRYGADAAGAKFIPAKSGASGYPRN